MSLLALISGAMSGLLGVGSGMNFSIGFVFILRMDLKKAAATGCFVMSILAGANLFALYIPGFITVPLNEIYPYCLITWLVGLVGVILGFIFSNKIKRIYLNLLVGIVLLICGIVAIIEFFVLH